MNTAALRSRPAALHPLQPFLFRCFGVNTRFIQAHQFFVDYQGHAMIPSKFVLDLPSCPSDLLGYELGKESAKYRKQYRELTLLVEDFQQLDGSGFAWCTNEWKWENMIVPALLKYKELHGDMHVPQGFVVPSSEAWPEKMWEMRLGKTVRSIRSSGYFVRDDPGRRQWLEENGFVFDVRELQWEAAKHALATYKEPHGDIHVRRAFVVPSSEA